MDDLDAMLNDLTAQAQSAASTTAPASDADQNNLYDMLGSLQSTSISSKPKASVPPVTSNESVHKVTEKEIEVTEKEIEEVNPTEVKVDNLDGVLVRRIPITEPDFETSSTKESIEYQVENSRDYSMLLRIEFKGTNFVLSPLGRAELESENTLSAVIDAGDSFLFCSITARDVEEKYKFKAKMQVTPCNKKESKEEDLEGVILSRVITHDANTHVQYACTNNKDFAVTCTIDVKGDAWTAGKDFKESAVVEPGQTVDMGSITSSEDIHSSWAWKGSALTTADGTFKNYEPDVAESELQGVYLIRSIYPSIDGAPGEAKFDVKNTREHDVSMSIEVTGEVYGEGNVTGVVKSGETTLLGSVKVTGEMSISWKWEEVKQK